MPRVSVTRRLRAAPEEVWRVLCDPERLPAWWPGVRRVEEATSQAWTKVLVSERGKTVRADYTRLEMVPERRLVWRHEVDESPFERLLRRSITEFDLRPVDGETEVTITVRHDPRGFARFGFVQLRRAAARQAEGALAGLQALVEA